MSQKDGKRDVIYMVAHLQKKSRGRSMLTVFSNWNARKVCLHVSKKLTYWDGETLKGEITLDGASTRLIHPSDADGKMYAFEVMNKDGQSLMFCTDSDEITTSWMNGIAAVVNGTWNKEKIDMSEDHAHLVVVERTMESLREELRAMNVKNRTELQTLRLEFASAQQKSASDLEAVKKASTSQSTGGFDVAALRSEFETQMKAFQTKVTGEVETLRQENLTLKAELLLQTRQSRLPVGSIQAFDGNEAALALLAASGWAVCDGTSPESQGIVNSILTATPNLTTEGRYLLVSGAPLSMEMSGTVNVDAAALTNVEQSLKTLNVMYIILVK